MLWLGVSRLVSKIGKLLANLIIRKCREFLPMTPRHVDVGEDAERPQALISLKFLIPGRRSDGIRLRGFLLIDNRWRLPAETELLAAAGERLAPRQGLGAGAWTLDMRSVVAHCNPSRNGGRPVLATICSITARAGVLNSSCSPFAPRMEIVTSPEVPISCTLPSLRARITSRKLLISRVTTLADWLPVGSLKFAGGFQLTWKLGSPNRSQSPCRDLTMAV